MHGVSLQLENKVALITGGSRGIGAETVRLFTASGSAGEAFSYQEGGGARPKHWWLSAVGRNAAGRSSRS